MIFKHRGKEYEFVERDNSFRAEINGKAVDVNGIGMVFVDGTGHGCGRDFSDAMVIGIEVAESAGG